MHAVRACGDGPAYRRPVMRAFGFIDASLDEQEAKIPKSGAHRQLSAGVLGSVDYSNEPISSN